MKASWFASRSKVVAFALTAALCGLPAHATGAPPASRWNAVIADAKKEGAVVMYLNPGQDEQFQAAADAFTRQYGIAVTFAYGDGASNTQKVLAEVQTGHVKSDVYSAGLGPLYTLYKAGDVTALDPPNAANLIKTFDVLSGATPLFVNVYGILVNTAKLGKTPLPTSWQSLLAPAFAGKLVMQDPRTDGGGGTFFVSTYDKFGRSFEQKLAAQHPVINGAGGGNAAEEAVARGDYTVMPAGRPHAIVTFPQAPLRWIAPAEGSIAVPIAMMMVKGAPHPNAARLWADWLLRPDVQSSLSTVAVPVVKGAVIKSPLVKLAAAGKFLEVLPPSQDRAKYYAEAKDLYGAQ